jgi:peptidoglycan/LPS O-acetylase OafA/YrhL
VEIIIEGILSLLGEIVLYFFAEVLFELGAGAIGHGLKKKPSSNPFVSGVGYLLVGAIIGAASAWIMPNRIFPATTLNGVSLVLAPLGVGVLMMAYGKHRHSKGRETTYLATFWGGGLFAFTTAFVRWWMVTKA